MDTFRATLSPWDSAESVKEIASRFGVNPSAISQRRTRMLSAVDDLRTEVDGATQLVSLIRQEVARLVHLDDLPTWVVDLLSVRPEGDRNPGDIALLVINVAIDRPHLVSEEGGPWMSAITQPDGVQLRDLKSLANSFVDVSTENGSRVLRLDDLDDLMVAWGVSPKSLARFRSLLTFPARRIVVEGGRCVLLDRSAKQNVGRTIDALQSLLDVSETHVVDLLVAQHQRAKGALLNELSVRRNS